MCSSTVGPQVVWADSRQVLREAGGPDHLRTNAGGSHPPVAVIVAVPWPSSLKEPLADSCLLQVSGEVVELRILARFFS